MSPPSTSAAVRLGRVAPPYTHGLYMAASGIRSLSRSRAGRGVCGTVYAVRVCVYQLFCIEGRQEMGVRPNAGSQRGEYDLSNPVGSFVEVVRTVVTTPAQFFSSIHRRGNFLSPLVFALICIEISTILEGFSGSPGTPRRWVGFGSREWPTASGATSPT
jgi:hypothetical protein